VPDVALVVAGVEVVTEGVEVVEVVEEVVEGPGIEVVGATGEGLTGTKRLTTRTW